MASLFAMNNSRPVSRHFENTTTVEHSNAALKELVLYEDANAAIGTGTVNDKILDSLWQYKNCVSYLKCRRQLHGAF